MFAKKRFNAIFFSFLTQKYELRYLRIAPQTSVRFGREWRGFGLKECVPRGRKKEKLREQGLLPRCEEAPK